MSKMPSSREQDIAYFHDHQYELRGLICSDSLSSGPTLLVVGGTHGNEPSGVKAIMRMHQELQNNTQLLMKGRVFFLLANPEAYIRDVRYIDQDLNRSFLVSALDQNYESKRAKEISTFIEQLDELVGTFDIHSVSQGHLQMMVYNIHEDESRFVAENISPIGTHFAYYSEHIRGLLIEKALEHGSTCLAIECGNHTDLDAPEVAFYHVYRFMHYFGLLPKIEQWDQLIPEHHLSTIDQYETLCPIRPQPQMRYCYKGDEQTAIKLNSGEIYAEGHMGPIRAEHDCYLVMPSGHIKMTDIDVGYLCRKNTLKLN